MTVLKTTTKLTHKKDTAGASAKAAISTFEKAKSLEVVLQIKEALRLAFILSEKCELKEARNEYSKAVRLSKEIENHALLIESLTGLLRLASEAYDPAEMDRIEKELDRVMYAHRDVLVPSVWYCKGQVALYRRSERNAQIYFHRYIRALKQNPDFTESNGSTSEDGMIKGWYALALLFMNRRVFRRAETVIESLLAKEKTTGLPRGLKGLVYLMKAEFVIETQKDFDLAEKWFHSAHVEFMMTRNWYYHLFVLLGYAKISRHRRQYEQAKFYLDLLDRATLGNEFGLLKQRIIRQRRILENDTVDLLIDCTRGVIKTRDGEEISVRKQYVLLDILAELSRAHLQSSIKASGSFGSLESKDGLEIGGLSKSDIIEKVWQEKYRPEAHDNKLYYNINRLRKLIEPNFKAPKYLLNWKQGYRLAPGLKVQILGSDFEK